MLDETSGTLQLAGTFGSAGKVAVGLANPEEPLAEKLMRSKKPLTVRDLEAESLWRNQALTHKLGLRTLLGAPLILEQRALGAFMLLSPSPVELMPGDEPLLEVFAMQLLAAWELWRALLGLHESERRLVQAEGLEVLAELAMGETHDFNNALGLILGNAHMLRSKLASTEEALGALDVIEQAVNDAAERVKRLQGLKSKIADGPRVDQVHLSNLAEEVLQFMRIKFKEVLIDGGTIEVHKDLRCTFPVLANPALLKEALLNLVMNSIRAMPKGGKITLRTWEDVKKVHLSVSDTGLDISSVGKKGKPPRPLPSRSDAGPGLSMGIATACTLIESLDGEIVVHKEEGMGTTVTITFPKAEGQAQGSLAPKPL
jgi:signal transduction histidine kinase